VSAAAVADLDWVVGFEPLPDAPTSADPLRFPGYGDQLARAEAKAGADESVVCGRARIADRPVVVAAFAFAFLGGSMGEATGRRLVAAIETAIADRVPLVTLAASGGARMQEGMRSLVQMQAVAGALARLRAAGVPHLSVARHPTTGGVWASMASMGDVIIAVAGATVAFAGPRVRTAAAPAPSGPSPTSGPSAAAPAPTSGPSAPTPGPSATAAFEAEGKFAAGAVDAVAAPEELGSVVGRYVRVLSAVLAGPAQPCDPPLALPDACEQAQGWAAVQLARRDERPRADAYLDAYFETVVELSGDRAGGQDESLRCGIGLRDGRAVAFAAQLGVPNAAAGFRTATRVIGLAGRWGIPVLTLIDTPSSDNDADAERSAIGTAIAQTFAAVAEAPVPITSLVIGEGGSGGALALAAPGRLWAVPSSYFSVIAPEGAAAILHRDRDRAPEVAEHLRLAPADLLELGVIRGIVGVASTPAQRVAA
jgi:acyl-CoA carboxylase subunit beta